MGWHSGPPSWTEMERVLNGKPRRAGWPIDEQVGDGGDSPAWPRKRGSYEPLDVQRPGSAGPLPHPPAPLALSLLDRRRTPEGLPEEAARHELPAIGRPHQGGR